MKKTILVALSVLLAFVAAADAQLVNENLLTEMPSGYKVGFQTRKDNMQMTEMVPAAETVNDWTEIRAQL